MFDDSSVAEDSITSHVITFISPHPVPKTKLVTKPTRDVEAGKLSVCIVTNECWFYARGCNEISHLPPYSGSYNQPLSEGQVGPRAGFRYLKVPFTRLTC